MIIIYIFIAMSNFLLFQYIRGNKYKFDLEIEWAGFK